MEILSRIIHSCTPHPHLVGVNCDVQYDLSTLAFKIGCKIEDFHIRILRLQQEVIISGEYVSPTTHLFQYMKALSKSNNIKGLIVAKMTNIITLLDNRKYAVYTGGNILEIYWYLKMIGSPKTLTT